MEVYKEQHVCPCCGGSLGGGPLAGVCLRCLANEALRKSELPKTEEEFGHYRVVRRLGRGGMGVVYEAEDLTNGRHVALKVMGRAFPSEADRRRFILEGRAAAAVNHPNLVYVYGSDEIEGRAVIMMELQLGGTLGDSIRKHGAFKPPEAVAIALQMIEGLEALGLAGILHRDLKPSNCFLGGDGLVRVGDFGLASLGWVRQEAQDGFAGNPSASGESSLLDTRRPEALATVEGSARGTPGYAAPEQWAGALDLDVRADIYSLGVTLFEMVHGYPPFRVPASGSVGPESRAVPKALLRVIERCLSTERSGRFPTYAALRAALLPLKDHPLEPAELPTRLVAGYLDYFVGSGVFLLGTGYLFAPPQEMLAAIVGRLEMSHLVVGSAFFGAYFGLSEAWFGRSLGKRLLGLHVKTVDGAPLTVGASFCRALLFVLMGTIPPILAAALASAGFAVPEPSIEGSYAILGVYWLYFGLCYVGMRRSNRFAAFHDLITGTRVFEVQGKARSVTPAVNALHGGPESFSIPHSIGPYRIVRRLWERQGRVLWLGHDSRLQRSVWIHCVPEGSYTLSQARKEMSRPGRLRWLAGRREPGIGWDAYEAFEGMAFRERCERACGWNEVRHWLHGMATECRFLVQGGECAAPLDTNHLWVAEGGRLVLLDFPAPGASEGKDLWSESREVTVGSIQGFLWEIAAMGMQQARNPIRVSAGHYLDALKMRSFTSVDAVVTGAEELLSGPAELGRTRRLVSLVMIPFLLCMPPFLDVCYEVIQRDPIEAKLAAVTPGAPELKHLLDARLAGPSNEVDNTPLAAILDQRIVCGLEEIRDQDAFYRALAPWRVGAYRRIVARATEAVEAAQADVVIPNPRRGDSLDRIIPILDFFSFRSGALPVFGGLLPNRLVWEITSRVNGAFLLMAVFDWLWIVCLGRSMALSWLGIAVVAKNGTRVGRARLLVRAIIGWATALALLLLVVTNCNPPWSPIPRISILCNQLALVGGIILIILCVSRPSWSPLDWLTRTRLTLK